MKHLKITFLLFSLSLFSMSLIAQIPDGGIRLNAETGSTYVKYGQCTASNVTVEGQAFTQAIHIEVGSAITNSWDAQIKFNTIAGIENGDVLLVSFFARTLSSLEETGEGNVTVVVENSTSYAKDLSYTITIGNEWRQYYASAKSEHTLSASNNSYLFHCGFPSQTIEVADVQFLNYKQTRTLEELPFTEITYFGQEPDAAWRALAAERINNIRKGVVDLKVYDEEGQVLKGAEVNVEMVQHQFGFGTAIAASEFIDNSTYRNKVLEMFNEVVFENDLKWPQFSISNTSHITRAMDTLDAHGIPIRGHNIIWPSWRFMPSSIEGLKDNPTALRNTIDNHIDQITQFTKGRIVDWDVINEPFSEHDVQDVLGDEIMTDWFKRTRQNDRKVKLYLNEYSIISSGGKNTTKQDYYYNLIKKIEEEGGEINGIGFQGHKTTELTSITKVYDVLEKFADLGKEFKITEFDIDTDKRNLQADYTRDFMTILFSHASVKSLMVWGFWEDRHWKPNAAFFNSDWSIRPHGQMWIDMIYNQWWTPQTTLTTDAQGDASLEGFLGKYKYSVTVGDITRTGFFTIDNSNQSGLSNEVAISLDQALPENSTITSSIDGFLCSGETATLSAPEGDGLSYAWYKDDQLLDELTAAIQVSSAGSYKVKVSKNGIDITSAPYEVNVNTSPLAELTLIGEQKVCEGEIITISATEEAGTEYYWEKNGKQFLAGTSSFDVENTGTYSLQTVANACVSNSESVTVTIAAKPEATINVTGDLPLCEGESAYLMATIDSRIDYTWYKDDVDINHTTRLFEVTESGSYTVKTTIDDCSTLSDPVDVMVNPNPEASITVTGELTFCEGSTVNLTGNSGENLIYTWKNGTTILETMEQSIDVGESGSYKLMTTMDNCSTTSDPVVVDVLAATDPACANTVINKDIQAKVYPNPFQGSFIVENANSETRIELFDVLGRRILDQKSTGMKTTISVTNPGIYLLKISGEDGSQILKVTGN
ncbi:MAG: endo-1,4-beta-xylanase [Bacteroidales bacterium]|jgi:endo-1,4-beta-xylanase|nr:endo-1,4-beta-xylanase [Bacteroidales bacterium]